MPRPLRREGQPPVPPQIRAIRTAWLQARAIGGAAWRQRWSWLVVALARQVAQRRIAQRTAAGYRYWNVPFWITEVIDRYVRITVHADEALLDSESDDSA